MQFHRNLRIQVTGGDVESFIAALNANVGANWTRDEAAEKNINDDAAGIGKYFCYTLAPDNALRLPKSTLFLLSPRDRYIYLANIVPKEQSGIKMDDYNELLKSFYDSVVKPATRTIHAEVDLDPQEKTLKDFLSKEAADHLQAFERNANKNALHPLDMKRWEKFLVEVYKSGKGNFGSYELAKWLEEQGGWSERTISSLQEEFEFGLDLLKVYETGNLYADR